MVARNRLVSAIALVTAETVNADLDIALSQDLALGQHLTHNRQLPHDTLAETRAAARLLPEVP